MKLTKYEKDCTKVDEGLYVSSELVARNRDSMTSNGITHVINTIGFICPNQFPDNFEYLLINILDSPQEDILVRCYAPHRPTHPPDRGPRPPTSAPFPVLSPPRAPQPRPARPCSPSSTVSSTS